MLWENEEMYGDRGVNVSVKNAGIQFNVEIFSIVLVL